MPTGEGHAAPLWLVGHGDCVELLRVMEPSSIDAAVTDPPYGIEFMQSSWDAPWEDGAGQMRKLGLGERPIATPSFGATAPQGTANATCASCGGRMRGKGQRLCSCAKPQWKVKGRLVQAADGAERMQRLQAWVTIWATELLRVLKPGAYAAVFGGTRTWHRLACGLEDAGFEIRDTLCWLYGTGWPKHHNAMKPGWEPVLLARRPLVGSVARNVELHETGELGIDACRIAGPKRIPEGRASNSHHIYGAASGNREDQGGFDPDLPRWPANVLLSHDERCMLVGTEQIAGDSRVGQEKGTRPGGFGDIGAEAGDGRPAGPLRGNEEVAVFACVPGCPVRGLDDQAGERPVSGAARRGRPSRARALSGKIFPGLHGNGNLPNDRGGPSRYYYCSKASSKERDAGLTKRDDGKRSNTHVTVKPLDLMRWLVRLVVPPDGTAIDPFCGSGTTGCAAVLEGRSFVGIEREAEYVAIAEARIAHWEKQKEVSL